MTNILDVGLIEQEFLFFLRNSDIISISDRGVSTVTEEFNGDGNEKDFTVANSAGKNVRTVTVGSISQTFGTDYSVSFSSDDTITVTFTTAPAVGVDNVDVTYDYGNSDKIYSDFPRPDLSISSFPRIAFDIISLETADAGFGNVCVSDIDIQVNIYAKSKNTMQNYSNTLRTAILANRDSFTYLKRIIPIGMGDDLKHPSGKDKILTRAFNFRSILNYENN